jgi:hypothetical protein
LLRGGVPIRIHAATVDGIISPSAIGSSYPMKAGVVRTKCTPFVSTAPARQHRSTLMADDFDPDLLIDDSFHVYFPVYTIGDAKRPGVKQITFDPKVVCHVQLLATEKRDGFVMLFTDEDLAERAVEAYSAIKEKPYCCVVRIDTPQHLIDLLRFYQRNGIKYVGTDNTIGPNSYGHYRPIEHIIRATSEAERIPEDQDEL